MDVRRTKPPIVSHMDPDTLEILAKHLFDEPELCSYCSGTTPRPAPWVSERARKAIDEYNIQSPTQAW